MANLGVPVDKVPEDNTVHALHARILAKRQARMACALAREQTLAVRSLAGLPPIEEDLEDAEVDSNISGSEQIMLDPYCVFDQYSRTENGKGEKRKRKQKKGKQKGKCIIGTACLPAAVDVELRLLAIKSMPTVSTISAPACGSVPSGERPREEVKWEVLNHGLPASRVSTLAETTVQSSLLPAEHEKKRQRDVLADCKKQASTAAPAGDSSIHSLARSPAAPATLFQRCASACPASPECPDRPHNKLVKNEFLNKTELANIVGARRSEYRGRGRPMKTKHVHDVHTPSHFMVQIDVRQNLQLFVLPKGIEKFFKGIVPWCIQLCTSPHCHWNINLSRYEEKLVFNDVEAGWRKCHAQYAILS
ncbi:uncharacterized protein LOC119360936 [Triticum dicoccoides]|uniref:uncharacterized protein LOC119360936 n=1 Tax=Triticum dicoccoides TaxID=85692 RepID=UPI00188E66D4|nr:uncharacterized protein LOC119360936 [Triticum dicoccoides]